MSQSEKSQ